MLYEECSIAELAQLYVDGLSRQDLIFDGKSVKLSAYLHRHSEDTSEDDIMENFMACHTLKDGESLFDFMNDLLQEVAIVAEARGQEKMRDRIRSAISKIKIE